MGRRGSRPRFRAGLGGWDADHGGVCSRRELAVVGIAVGVVAGVVEIVADAHGVVGEAFVAAGKCRDLFAGVCWIGWGFAVEGVEQVLVEPAEFVIHALQRGQIRAHRGGKGLFQMPARPHRELAHAGEQFAQPGGYRLLGVARGCRVGDLAS